ncbi:MAG: type II secretion system protein [Clostridia bacterium]|nr:type II secretion system protein [Clostridia bacterium]
MRNNKGFSLVELIIVIAIMAILIGVMAPQLIKYIEKTNVSSDTQLADTVKSAITTAMLDPAVITAPGYTQPASGTLANVISGSGTEFQTAVEETLGCTAAECVDKLKSKDATGIQVYIVNANSVHVEITGSHADGKGGAQTIYVD